MTRLFEKYRPETLAEVVAQPKAVDTIIRFKDRGGLAGRAFWISGKSGQGKTTLAKLIAYQIADPFYTEHLDAGELTTGRLADLNRSLSLYGAGGKTGRAVIVDEAHGLKKAIIRALLVMLEQIPKHVVWIFTTTNDGMSMFEDDNIDASPLLSRCDCISLAQRDVAKPFAERAREIAQAEGLDGKPLTAYIRLVNEKGGNMRAVLNEIEAGRMLE